MKQAGSVKNQQTKVCPKCKEAKPVTAFYNQAGSDRVHLSLCKLCKKAEIKRAQTLPYEERPDSTTLSPFQCRLIRQYFDAKSYTQEELARMFGVSQPLISQVVRFRPTPDGVSGEGAQS